MWKTWTIILALSMMLAACESTEGIGDRGSVGGKADHVSGTCSADDCGSVASDGTGWCDDLCADHDDCAQDVGIVCGYDECSSDAGCLAGEICLSFQCELREPVFCEDGVVATEASYFESSDGMECASETDHCVTTDYDACPRRVPPAPTFCPDGAIVAGQRTYFASSDGMECEIVDHHCVTADYDACPRRAPPAPTFCPDGTVVAESYFIPSSDGMECELVELHCLSNDSTACPN